MRKLIPYNNNKLPLLLIAICIIAVGIGYIGIGSAFASSQAEFDDFSALCKAYTDNEYLYEEVNAENNRISSYEDYVNSHIAGKTDKSITDERILKIVPLQLFEEKVQNFLYIGRTYGFFVDYEPMEDTFLVYLILHNEYQNIFGQYTREITPLYYEKYIFDRATKEVRLIFNDKKGKFEKYSDIKDIYLKDVSFTGKLSNTMHINQGEESYIGENDLGAYFYGNHYKFRGVSARSKNTEFKAQSLKTFVGYLPSADTESLGSAFDVAEVSAAITSTSSLKSISSGDLQNDTYYGNKLESSSATEMTKQNGNLFKASGAIMEMADPNRAVLFGIRDDCYVQNALLISYSDSENRWNTRFTGKMQLDIAEVDGSKVTDIATDVISLDYVKNFDNGEKTELQESEERSVYLLAGSEHHIRFNAPVSGKFTLKTRGTAANDIAVGKGTLKDIDNGVNKELKVDLEYGEILGLCVTKRERKSSATVNIIVEFTPDEIAIGETKELHIRSGQYEYLLFNSESISTPFAFDIRAQGNLSLNFADRKFNNYSSDTIYGSELYGSRLVDFKGRCYLILSNTTDSEQTVSITLNNIEKVVPNDKISENTIYQRVYELSSPYSSGIKVAYESEAPITMRIFDTDHNQLAWTSDSQQKELIFSAKENDKYYIVVNNLLYKAMKVDLSVSLDVHRLDLGNNELSKPYDGSLTSFTTKDTDATYLINSDISMTVYDAAWQKIVPSANNGYHFAANSMYYIYATGSLKDFYIGIDIKCTDYTEADTGVFDTSGMVLIKYVPAQTSVYKVNDSLNSEWYNSYLRKHNGYLYAGNTYYLKLKGNVGEQYAVRIERNANRIPLNSGLSLGDGYYFFDITERGKYTLWVTCLETMSASITITDDSDNVIKDGLRLVNASVELDLEVGLYYLDLSLFNGTKASLRIEASTAQ